MVKELHAVPNVAATVVVHPTPGVGDATTIAEGIALLPATGGCVYLREGTYSISSTITLPDKDVVIRGSGEGTVISPTGAITVFTFADFSPDRRIVIGDLKVDGSQASLQKLIRYDPPSTGHNIQFERIRTVDIRQIVDVVSHGSLAGEKISFNECIFQPYGSAAVLIGGNFVGQYFFKDCILADMSTDIGWNISSFSTSIVAVGSEFQLESDCSVGNLVASDCSFRCSGQINFTLGSSGFSLFSDISILNSFQSFEINWISLGGTSIFSSGEVLDGTIDISSGNIESVKVSTFGAIAKPVIRVVTGTIIGCRTVGTTGGQPAIQIGVDCIISGCQISKDGSDGTEGIRIAAGENTIDSCIFSGTAFIPMGGTDLAIKDATLAPSSRINNIHYSLQTDFITDPYSFSAGFNSVVVGQRRLQKTGTTGAAFVSQFKLNRLSGGIGTIKETGGVNSMNVMEAVEDYFGTVTSVTTLVAAGGSLRLDPTVNIGSARPPYKSYEILVANGSGPGDFDIIFEGIGGA